MTFLKYRYTTITLLLFSSFASADSINLSGVWETSCFFMEKSEQRPSEFSKNIRIFRGNEETLKRVIYFDECKTPKVEFTVVSEYATGKKAVIDGSYEIDWQVKNVYFEPKSKELASIYNLGSVCGITNWRQNVKQDVTKTPCYFLVTGQSKLASFYGIFKKVEDFAVFSSFGLGVTKQTRNLQLDLDNGYEKVSIP